MDDVDREVIQNVQSLQWWNRIGCGVLVPQFLFVGLVGWVTMTHVGPTPTPWPWWANAISALALGLTGILSFCLVGGLRAKMRLDSALLRQRHVRMDAIWAGRRPGHVPGDSGGPR